MLSLKWINIHKVPALPAAHPPEDLTVLVPSDGEGWSQGLSQVVWLTPCLLWSIFPSEATMACYPQGLQGLHPNVRTNMASYCWKTSWEMTTATQVKILALTSPRSASGHAGSYGRKVCASAKSHCDSCSWLRQMRVVMKVKTKKKEIWMYHSLGTCGVVFRQ